MNSHRPASLNSAGRRLLAFGLTALLFAHPALALRSAVLAADDDTPTALLPEAPMPAESGGLTIEILDGDQALNNIRQRTAREPIVQVEDKNHKAVAGALVLFTINSGPSGAGGAVDGATTFSVRTGPDGKATLHGLKPNSVSGQFTITVSATLGVLTAAAILIHQQNTPTGAAGEGENSAQNPAQTAIQAPGQAPGESAPVTTGHKYLFRGSIGKTIALGGSIVGVAIIIAVIAATRSTSGTTITAGAGKVGAP